MGHLLRVMGYNYELWYTFANYDSLLNKLFCRIMVHFYELWITTANYGVLLRIMDYFIRLQIISATACFCPELFMGALLCVPFFCDTLRNDIWKMFCFENGTLVLEIRVTFK